MAKSITALKKYYRADRHLVRDADELLKDLEKESDRSSIVILASIIEDTLQLRLATLMRKFKNDDEFNRMFGPDGPLGTFSAKIAMGYYLRVIEAETRAQLDVLRELRNAAAHSQRPISFATPEMRAVCFRMFNADLEPFFAKSLAETDMRTTFMMECQAISVAISRGSRANVHDSLQKIFGASE